MSQVCGSGSVVERCLAKANVASSNLVFRSKFKNESEGLYLLKLVKKNTSKFYDVFFVFLLLYNYFYKRFLSFLNNQYLTFVQY